MEALFVAQGLPIQWLTVRRNGEYPDFEGGQIDLFPGRGGWSGTQGDDGWNYSLSGPQSGTALAGYHDE